MKKSSVSIIFAFILLVLTSVSAQANLVNNPGFESYGAASNFGIHSPTDWAITGDPYNWSGSLVEVGSYIPIPTLNAHTGSAYLVGGTVTATPGTISQSVATTNGLTYNLNFFLANSSGLSLPDNYWGVLWDGVVLDSGNNLATFSWTEKSYSVKGTGNDLLQFVLANGTTCGVFGVDDVSLTPTPIPAAAWLLGSGIMGLVGIRRRSTI